MSREELKQILIERIEDVQDDDILEAIQRMLDVSSSSDKIYKLSDQERKSIQASRADIANGRVTSHEDLKKEINEWLDAE
jgi:predicted transcriptional regulator